MNESDVCVCVIRNVCDQLKRKLLPHPLLYRLHHSGVNNGQREDFVKLHYLTATSDSRN